MIAMEKKRWDYNRRIRARGILTGSERSFLEKMESRHGLSSNRRNYLSSIIHKSRKGIADLDLIFKKLDYPDILFIFSEHSMSLKEPIQKLVEILYHESKGDKKETEKRLNKIVESALNKLE